MTATPAPSAQPADPSVAPLVERAAGAAPDHLDADDARLRELGYPPQLKRALGLFQNMSVGFTYLSPVVGVYALFALLLPVGGPAALFWSIPLVVVGQTLVALVFGEVSSHWPLAGGVYQWARRLLGSRYGWMTAWVYLCALMATISSVAVLADVFFAALLGYESTATTKFLLAAALLGLGGLLNLAGPRALGRVALAGFWAEVVGSVGLGVYLLVFHNRAGLDVVTDTTHVSGDSVTTGMTTATFLGALLFSMWIFYGFEACGDVAEEVRDASRRVPRAMLLTIGVAAASSVVITLGFLVGIPDYGALFAGGDDPIATVLDDAFGGSTVLVDAMYALICLAFVSCVLAIQAATSRLLFSFARDRMVPFSHVVAHVNRHRVPDRAIIATTLTPLAIAAVDVFATGGRLVYFAIAGMYVAFQLVVFAALVARLRGWRPEGRFTLGRAGLVVNAAALAYGVFGIWVLCTQGGAFAADGNFVDRNLVVVSLVVVVGAGLAYLLLARPTRALDEEEVATSRYRGVA
ncbi:MAG: APC family permease [Phycicoccus sp.]